MTTLKLAKNSKRRAALKRKLTEYKKRIAKAKKKIYVIDAKHKAALLEALLNDGSIDIDNFRESLNDSLQEEFSYTDFERAVFVITDYCDTGGANVWGGTGLK
jgi:hypothetical protein